VRPGRIGLLRDGRRDARLARHHRFFATRAHLLELAGDHAAAVAGYRKAARRTTSLPERRRLTIRAAELEDRTRRP
jgi:predicted RNA polymerase sigma factor